jgi:hypothetical protein
MNAHRATPMVYRGRPIDREESLARHALKEHGTMGRITHRLLLAVTLAFVVALPGLLCPAQAGAADDVLDQSQAEDGGYLLSVGGEVWSQVAQIATAGQYGFLHQVSVYIDNLFATGPITVSIQTVIDGMPSGIEIGKGTISVDDLPPQYGDPQWVDVQINGGVGLVMAPGTQYAIVLSEASGTAQWHGSPDVYPDGYFAVNYGSGWSSVANADAMFQTYVIPDSLDQILYYPAEGYYYTFLSLTNWANTDAQQAAQTFTAGQIGVVDRVRLYMQRAFTTSNVEISIQTTDNGYPSGVEIGHGFIPYDAMPDLSSPAAWIEAAIKPSRYVITGGQYAIVVSGSCCGQFWWLFVEGINATYGGGQMLYNGGSGWTEALPAYSGPYFGDAGFQTFVVHPAAPSMTGPPGRTITPCSFGICPAATGNVTPADSTARITSNVQFRERPDGTVHGILNFNDSRTGDLALKGCVTDSAACRLTVTTFACTDENSMTIGGTYTPRGETATDYRLTLSGVKDGIGTFTLNAGDYTYTLTRYGIVDVACP